MEKKGTTERVLQPRLSLLYLGLALLTGVVVVEVYFVHHLFQEVSLIKAELSAEKAVKGHSEGTEGPTDAGLFTGDRGTYVGWV